MTIATNQTTSHQSESLDALDETSPQESIKIHHCSLFSVRFSDLDLAYARCQLFYCSTDRLSDLNQPAIAHDG